VGPPILFSRTAVSEPGSWDNRGVYTVKIYALFAGACWLKDTVSAVAISGDGPADSLRHTTAGGARFWGGEANKRGACLWTTEPLAYLKRSSTVRAKGNDKGKVKGWWAKCATELVCADAHGWQLVENLNTQSSCG